MITRSINAISIQINKNHARGEWTSWSNWSGDCPNNTWSPLPKQFRKCDVSGGRIFSCPYIESEDKVKPLDCLCTNIKAY